VSRIHVDSWSPRRWTSFRRALHRWYIANHRKLAWRAAPGKLADPYAALVSEAMLQQTQVATVEPYFDRFMKRFPTVAALAAADESAVLQSWQGLGYYRRARNLHRAARVIVEQFDGQLPGDAIALQQLPGVGRYTAGAIASMSFGKRSPILDGNVARVLARVHGITDSIDDRSTTQRLWALAARFVEGRLPPGDLNQALMELGATICTPKSPACDRCPVGRFCDAASTNRVEQLPVRSTRKQARAVTHHVLAIHKRGQYLFERRPDQGLWSRMWQMPTRESNAASLVGWAADHLGLTIQAPRCIGDFEHITTHRRITFRVWLGKATGGRLRRGAGRWRRLNDVDDLAMSTAQRRVIELVERSATKSRR